MARPNVALTLFQRDVDFGSFNMKLDSTEDDLFPIVVNLVVVVASHEVFIHAHVTLRQPSKRAVSTNINELCSTESVPASRLTPNLAVAPHIRYGIFYELERSFQSRSGS